jgi:DUF971 family protein
VKDANAIRPARLASSADLQELSVTWADGHVSTYSFEGLKRACPCVECRGGHSNTAAPIDPFVFHVPSLMTYVLKQVEPAGNYAVRFHWGDGHSAGLYRWETLRGYCPCEQCEATRAK